MIQSITSRTRKIVCLLKNYEAHAKEMQGVPPSSPEFFLKVEFHHHLNYLIIDDHRNVKSGSDDKLCSQQLLF